MLYRIEGLKKVYGGRPVLDLDDLEIESGKIHVVMGPNGAGKTTLLQILAFLTPPTSGRLRFKGEPITWTRQALLRLRRQAVLVEQFPILFSTSVFKNVEFGLKVRGMSARVRRRVVEENLALVGMDAYAGVNGRHLSGGETQRVAIARALACGPEVILLDEPTSSVDVKHQLVIENIIRDIHAERHVSVVFCTHSLAQAARLAHEKHSLYDGRAAGRFYENLFSGTVHHVNGRPRCRLTPSLVFPCPPGTPEGAFRFAIDPHGLQMLTDGVNSADAFVGRVVQLADERDGIRVTVDAGVLLNLLIPKSDLVKRRLFIDADVRLVCPETAVIPI